MQTLNELGKETQRIREKAGWNDRPLDNNDRIACDFALMHSEVGQGVGQAVGSALDFGGRQLGAGDVEVLAVGVRLQTPLEQRRHRVLLVADPDAGAHQPISLAGPPA